MFRAAALLLLVLPLAQSLLAKDYYLFTSFRKNGETGVFFALSDNGREWTPLNNNLPVIPPAEPGELMRDPWLGQGPDGVWHLLWTWGWARDGVGHLRIGHSSSSDLIRWTPHQSINLLDSEPTAKNAWAPEAVYDPAHKEWSIFWATTIPGRFPEVEGAPAKGNNHRLYSITTRDWTSFTPARLWFDPGFNSIDSTVIHDGNRWIMIFKDERIVPQQKRLRLAFSASPAGPWTNVSEPISDDWNEGPSAIKIGPEWWIYFDHYTRPQHYGALRTTDWKHFEDVSGQLQFPADHRHGTVVKISEAEAAKLRQAFPGQ